MIKKKSSKIERSKFKNKRKLSTKAKQDIEAQPKR